MHVIIGCCLLLVKFNCLIYGFICTNLWLKWGLLFSRPIGFIIAWQSLKDQKIHSWKKSFISCFRALLSGPSFWGMISASLLSISFRPHLMDTLSRKDVPSQPTIRKCSQWSFWRYRFSSRCGRIWLVFAAGYCLDTIGCK